MFVNPQTGATMRPTVKIIAAIVSAAATLTVVACSSEEPQSTVSKPDQVRAKLHVTGNPAERLADEQLAQIGRAACGLIQSRNGDITILQTLANNTPVQGYTLSQVVEFNMRGAEVYCPEVVGD